MLNILLPFLLLLSFGTLALTIINPEIEMNLFDFVLFFLNTFALPLALILLKATPQIDYSDALFEATLIAFAASLTTIIYARSTTKERDVRLVQFGFIYVYAVKASQGLDVF